MKSCILFFSAMACVPQFTSDAIAGTTEPLDQRIQAAIALEEVAEPRIGDALCEADSRCEIISDHKLGVNVTVDRRGEGPNGGSRLTVICPEDCSFASGRSTANFQSQREFDLFSGVHNQVEILPFLTPRTAIGKIFLIIE